MAKDLKCEVLETLITFPGDGDWHKELNLVKWNGNPPRYDLRAWNGGRSRMGKGITLSGEELKLLKEGLGGMRL